jgi:hypothetical protein
VIPFPTEKSSSQPQTTGSKQIGPSRSPEVVSTPSASDCAEPALDTFQAEGIEYSSTRDAE